MGRYVSTTAGLGALDPWAAKVAAGKRFCVLNNVAATMYAPTMPAGWTKEQASSSVVCFAPSALQPASAKPPMPGSAPPASDPITTQPLPGLPTSTPPAPSDTTTPAAPPSTPGVDIEAAKQALDAASKKTGLPVWAVAALGFLVLKKVLF